MEKNSIVSITDAMGRIEYANNNFCKILECEANQIIGESHKLIKSHLHSGPLYKNLWKTIRSGRTWKGILSDKSQSGKLFWLDTTIIPLKAEKKVKYLAIYHDVSQQHRENIHLNEQNITQKHFLYNMGAQSFIVSKFGKIFNANKKFGNLEIDNLIGTYIYDYISPAWYEAFKRNIEFVYKEKSNIKFETSYTNDRGQMVRYANIVSPIFDRLGHIESVMVSMYEMSKPVMKNEKFKDSESKYKTIYKSLNVGIIVVADSKGNILEWNKGAELAFGYSEAEILGRPLTVLMSNKLKKKNIKELLKAINKIKNHQKADVIEMRCLNKKGEEFPVEFALSILNDEENQLYCAMMLDITKRKTLENRLKQKTKDLELFLYRSAHDLKAPFSSAQGLIGLLKEELTNEKGRFITEMLDATITKGKMLSETLNEASVISSKNLTMKSIDFSTIIEDVLVVLKNSLNFDSVKFHLDIRESYRFVSNPELIGSIFQNLIQNALKYSIAPSQNHVPQVNIKVNTLQDVVIITVCDNGIGINKKSIEKIFDLYYRASSLDVPGNGIGLYIVKNIVEDLGGEIKVNSDLSAGTCFEIKLPNANPVIQGK